MTTPALSSSGLDLTFLGHQTWHVSDGTAAVLIDPILDRAFGVAAESCQIWPPREVDTAAMGQVAAVLLSHEHLDHFHLPSLSRLDRSVPIYTGTTTPQAVLEAIEQIGFTTHRVDYTQPVSVGTMEIVLYPAGAKTAFWESRVSQFLIGRTDAVGGEVFIAVDADISDIYLDQLAQGEKAQPRMAIVSNNSQSVPYGGLGADHNLLPGLDGPRNRPTGLEIFHELLITYLAPLDEVTDVAVCGNGFTAPRSVHGPFLYTDHPHIAKITNELQHLFTVHGPRPGERLHVPTNGSPVTSSRVGWVRPDTVAEQEGLRALEAFRTAPRAVEPAPLTPPLEPGEIDQARALLLEELPRLARDLVATPTGALAIGIQDYLHGPLGRHRLALRLIDPPGGVEGAVQTWLWDATLPDFVPGTDLTRAEAINLVPFGIEVFYQDFVRLFMGQVQIWDIVGASYQHWHIGAVAESPVQALFAIYGEHQRPDLAKRCYATWLAELNPSATPVNA